MEWGVERLIKFLEEIYCVLIIIIYIYIYFFFKCPLKYWWLIEVRKRNKILRTI